MVLRWNSQRVWGSSVPSVTHRLQAAAPAGRAIPRGVRQGEQELQVRDALLCQLFSNSFIQTLTAPLSNITKSPDPWVLTSQHSHLIPKGTISLGDLSITRCSCQSQGTQGSDSRPGTTHSVSATGTPALGTKLHPSQIPSPAAHTLRAGDLGVAVWR